MEGGGSGREPESESKGAKEEIGSLEKIQTTGKGYRCPLEE
jgi:hypothetical protein